MLVPKPVPKWALTLVLMLVQTWVPKRVLKKNLYLPKQHWAEHVDNENRRSREQCTGL
jgi:hypothetical protein